MPKEHISFTYTVTELLFHTKATIAAEQEEISELEAAVAAYPSADDFSDRGYSQHRQSKRDMESDTKRLRRHVEELQRWQRAFTREPGDRKLKLQFDDLAYFGF